MNEKQIRNIMLNLDSDLLDKELDTLMSEIDIDMDSILTKSQAKLEKEHKKMKKIRLIPIVAAIVCLMVGTTIVYADEISNFLKSFFGKSTVYSTVVDETAYYLETPVNLDGVGQINSVMFTAKYLNMAISTDANEIVVSVGDGNEYKPQGYSNGPNGKELTFFDLPLAQSIVVTLDGKQYSIQLSQAASAVANGDIISAELNSIDWINMGYKRTERGVQIFTSFTDEDLQLVKIGSPVNREVKDTFNKQTNTSNSQQSPTKPIFGYDKDGNTYEYIYEKNPLAWPVTRFESDAPAMQEITLRIPEVIVSYNKIFTEINIDIPVVNEENHPNLEINFGFQKMVLQNIARTSANTVELKFALNTGDTKNVFIYQAAIDSIDAHSGELLWQDNICTMAINIDEGLTQTELMVGYPMFIVSGDWIFNLK
jgi:hypothetical protein